jgi:hypothetical protein
MGTEFDLRPNFAVLVDHVANGQSRNFTNTHAGVNRENERNSISISMSRCLDNSKNATNIVVRED